MCSSILAGADKDEINQTIKEVKEEKLNTTVEGDLQDFLGAHIERQPDGSISLTQPHLMDQTLDNLSINKDDPIKKNWHKKVQSVLAALSKNLKQCSDSKPFDNSFNFTSVIGKLNCLEKGSSSNIACVTHQCA